MEIHNYYEQFDNCLQKEEAACTNRCPFHLNVFDFQDKMARHKYDRAYKDYKNAVCFPEIVAALCPEYCHDVCPRKDFDGAVQLNLLEKTCVAKAKRKTPTSYNLPQKEGKIGIIGGGMGGLTCALKLLEKKYEVIIFEKEDRVGGQVKEMLPEDIYLTEINRQFSKENFKIITDREINNLDELDEYDFNCIYVATGANGSDFGTMDKGREDATTGEHYYMKDQTLVLAGGSLTGKDVVEAIAHGMDMAWAIEVFLRTKKVEYHGNPRPTMVVPDTRKFIDCPPVTPTLLIENDNEIEPRILTEDNDNPKEVTAKPEQLILTEENDNPKPEQLIFTDEETEQEAKRCIRCQCDACKTYCDIADFHDQWPLSMREDVKMTVMSTESMIHKTPAIRLINTCTQCGLCKEVCPPNIEIDGMMYEARKLLHKQGKMPPAFHGYWLDDVTHANSDVARLIKNAPQSSKSVYAFFPGCNLGASDPRYVEKTYKWLTNNFDDMGLLLNCCGIPIDWAGNDDEHDHHIAELKNDWEQLGQPTLVTACPSCTKHINEYLPEIKTISIYELMSESGKSPQITSANVGENIDEKKFSIFDPCAARGNDALITAVRKTADKAAVNYAELPEKDKHGCCGFGGNVEVANPEFAKTIAQKRTSLSDNPYITYCSNCRDVFLNEGKPVIHMLDLLFDINDTNASLPDLTKRRKNREDLKRKLLKEYWGEDMTETSKYPFEIETSDEIREKMNHLKLVDDDIYQVIQISNDLNRRTHNKDEDEYICYAKLNYITCWVSYKMGGATSQAVDGDIYTITNVYTHRMDIKLEAVFNGKKTDAHMR